MKMHLMVALVALMGMTALSAKASVVLPPGYQDNTPLGSHQTFNQPNFLYSLPQAVWAGDVEIMDGSKIVEICEFVPELGNPSASVDAELIPVWSNTAPPLLSNTVQINWGHGSMTDYYPGDNSYCIGTVCNAVPLPASGSLSAAGLLLAVVAVWRKSRRSAIA